MVVITKKCFCVHYAWFDHIYTVHGMMLNLHHHKICMYMYGLTWAPKPLLRSMDMYTVGSETSLPSSKPLSLILGACTRGTIVVLCVSVSVTMLAATYPIYTLKTGCHWAFHGCFKVCIVWISLKMLCSKVLVIFPDHHCPLHFLSSSRSMKETATASFQED